MPIDFKPDKEIKIDFKPEVVATIDFQPEEKINFRSVEPAKIDFQPIDFTPLKIKKTDDSFSKMSKFQKVLDILGRPGYAIKSYLKSGQERTKNIYRKLGYPIETITEADKLPLEAHEAFQKEIEKVGLGQEIKEAGEALWKGLSGQERATMNEILGEAGVKGVPLAGFLGEVFTDPLMWGGGAGYKAITRTLGGTAKVIGKGIKAIPGVTKITTKIEPVTSALKTMFITKTGIGKLGELIEKHLLERGYSKFKELKFGIKVKNVIQNIARKTGRSVDDVERQIVTLIEQPQITLKGAPQESVALANVLRSHFSNILTAEMKAGVPIGALSAGSRNIQYFPRITGKETLRYLKAARKNYKGDPKIWNTMLVNAKKRKTVDWTLQEFNDFVASHGLKSLGGETVEKFFIQNPAYAVAIRGIRSAKAVTSAQFLDDVGKQFGLAKAPSFWQKLPDTVTKFNPSLKGLRFDPEVMNEITRVTSKYFNPQELNIFMRGFDTIQNMWKKWTLAPFPKYHIRNMVGNLWNNYLAGVGVDAYPKAQALQMYRKFKNKPGMMRNTALVELKKMGIATQQADDIIMQAERTGVLGHGWYGADIETTIERAIKGERGIIGRGMAFGTTIENNARLAHFIDKLGKGDDAVAAANSVKKFLFDYGDLTAFEKQIMRRVYPFFTWTRKNIPLQFEQLWKQPQKFAPLAVPLRGREPKDLLRLKYAKPWLYERLPVEWKRTVDTVTYVPLEGLIPAGDLTKMVRPQEMFIELLSPYLKTPIELAINKSFYFESEIQKYPKETQELIRLDIPVKLKYALTSILPQARMVNFIDKYIKRIDKKKKQKEPFTPEEEAFNFSLSTIYKTSISDLRKRALQTVKRKIDDLKKALYWAKRKKRTEEFQRIKETIKETIGIIKEIK